MEPARERPSYISAASSNSSALGIDRRVLASRKNLCNGHPSFLFSSSSPPKSYSVGSGAALRSGPPVQTGGPTSSRCLRGYGLGSQGLTSLCALRGVRSRLLVCSPYLL